MVPNRFSIWRPCTWRPLMGVVLGVLLACCPAVAVIASESAADYLPLSRIRYQQYGVERTEYGQVRYQEGSIELRLFSEKLGAYYVLQLQAEDLLDVSSLTQEEVNSVETSRADRVRERELERAELQKKRAAERARKKALAEEKRRNSRDQRSNDRRGSSRDRSGGSRSDAERRQPIELPPAQETVSYLESDIQKIWQRVAKMQTQVDRSLAGLKSKVDAKAVGRARRELLGFRDSVTEVSEALERRNETVESLREELDAGSLSAADAVDRAELVYRRLQTVLRKLDAAEKELPTLTKRADAAQRAVKPAERDSAETSSSVAPRGSSKQTPAAHAGTASSARPRSPEPASDPSSRSVTPGNSSTRTLAQSEKRDSPSATAPARERADLEAVADDPPQPLLRSESSSSTGVYWFAGTVVLAVTVLFGFAVWSLERGRRAAASQST